VIAGFPSQGEPLGQMLLEAVQPRLVILAGAEYPVADRPTRALLERLELEETPVVCTDRTGAATLVVRKAGWELWTMSGTRLLGRVAAAPPTVASDRTQAASR
jgi:hypothetical protein